LRSSYGVHYRRARRVVWTTDARADYTILFLLGGRLRYEAGDEAGEVVAGEALTLDPGIAAKAQGTEAEFLTLTLAPHYLLDNAVRARLIRQGARVVFRARLVQRDERLARLARDLAEELNEEEAGQEMVVAALIDQMAVHLLRRHSNVRRSDELELSRVGLVDRRIRRAVELMHSHLDQDLPLEEIASAAHLSPFHFSRLFKKLTGTSPHAYLATLRNTRAQALLAETDLSITEVSTRVGYSSSSHFTKAFRQATGLTPRAFRKAVVR
jgi:AraC-like DNA-binding protein